MNKAAKNPTSCDWILEEGSIIVDEIGVRYWLFAIGEEILSSSLRDAKGKPTGTARICEMRTFGPDSGSHRIPLYISQDSAGNYLAERL